MKIEAVIGATAQEMKPRAAEFWRSRRPSREIMLNLEALPEGVSLPATTQSATSITRSMPVDFAALGVTVGFNSLDGD